MKSSNLLANMPFASKIVMLVALMGFIAVAITSYTLVNTRATNQQYAQLLAHEARGALIVAEAAQHLGNASRLTYSVLTMQDELRMRAQLVTIKSIEQQFNADLQNFQQLLPALAPDVQSLTAKSERVFHMASRIIESAARWRGDRALQIIDSEFDPALATLRHDMGSLKDRSVQQFESASSELTLQTDNTIKFTAFPIAVALIVIIALSIHVAITQMSRPLAELTRNMELMSERQYGSTMVLTTRRDEIGKMANALQVFQQSMQREDRLAVEVAASAEGRRLSQQLVDLISAIPGAVFRMQMTPVGMRSIQFVSEKAAQLHGRPPGELEQLNGSPGDEFLHASAAAINGARDAFMHSARTLAPLNFDIAMTQDGTTRWLKTLATARRTDDGSTVFNGVWLDVSDQKKQAAILAKAKDAAEQAAADKARFLATISHEIRTPLNAILGMTQLAIQNEALGAQRGRLDKVLRAGKHLLNIVNDVLDISKIEAGKMGIELHDFAVNDWVQEICDLVEPDAEAKQLQLQWQIAPGVPAWVCGGRHRIGQILINYLNNAIKFTTSAGVISIWIDTVASDAHGLLLRCAVRDSGIGISQEDQALLFNAFAQADTSITRRFGGTGLGLAISRQLAQLMGGAAGVTSELGQGSEFWFTAKIQPAQAPAVVTANPQTSGLDTHTLRGLRALLVDDNEINRTVAHGMLQMRGVLVDEACNGQEAVAKLRSAADGTYAVVLMDMQMPVMDGMTATRVLREDARFAHLPVIALTANASEDDVSRTRAAGMNDHLAKPLLEQDLWRCLHRWAPKPWRESSPMPDAAHTESAQPPIAAMTAMNAMTAMTAMATPAAQIDAAALEDLRVALGPQRAHQLLLDFLRDTATRMVRMQAQAQAQSNHPDCPDWASLTKEAHDLSGNAGSFGLARLGDIAARVQSAAAARDEIALSETMALLVECARMDLDGLRAWASHEWVPTAAQGA